MIGQVTLSNQLINRNRISPFAAISIYYSLIVHPSIIICHYTNNMAQCPNAGMPMLYSNVKAHIQFSHLDTHSLLLLFAAVSLLILPEHHHQDKLLWQGQKHKEKEGKDDIDDVNDDDDDGDGVDYDKDSGDGTPCTLQLLRCYILSPSPSNNTIENNDGTYVWVANDIICINQDDDNFEDENDDQ